MISYKWAINKVQVIPQHDSGVTNVVTNVHWSCVATDEDSGISVACAAVKELALGDSFIPYADLTEQQILDWCFATQIVEFKDSNGDVAETFTVQLQPDVETQLAGQIEYRISQKAFEPDLPWAISTHP
jgi:hypothetical protein